MDTLTTWFNCLDPTLKVYWGIAIFASIVFLIQTTMSFIGMGDVDSAGADMDMDFDGTPDTDALDNAGTMHLLSIRNVIYFLLGFGWTGISLWHNITNRILLLIVAILIGCLFVAIFIYLFRMMMKLQSNGAFRIEDSVGKVCDVYLRIPANGEGMGKVQISLNGSVQELDARTDGSMIPSGTKVRVLRVTDKKVLEVEIV